MARVRAGSGYVRSRPSSLMAPGSPAAPPVASAVTRQTRPADGGASGADPLLEFVCGLSSRLATAAATQMDGEVDAAFRRLLELLEADRGVLFAVEADRGTARVKRRARRAGLPPIPAEVNARERFPWIFGQLVAGRRALRIDSLEQLPAEAKVDRDHLLRWQVRSVLLVPLLAGNAVEHAIAVASTRSEHRWAAPQVPRLRLFGQAVVDALARKALMLARDEALHLAGALRRNEQELEELRTRQWHGERVVQTGVLVASLAHELSQPLTATLSNAQAGLRFLAADTVDLSEIRDILADIVSDNKRATEMIESLRLMLRRQRTRRRVVDAARIVYDASALVRSELNRRQVMLETACAEGCTVLADPAQLLQVLLNLATNAMEAMEQTAAGERRLRLDVSCSPACEVLISVRDSGPGFTADGLERVFDAFRTTKSGGTGMGLAISRSIVESHGGRLQVERKVGPGATFVVSLPLAASPSPAD